MKIAARNMQTTRGVTLLEMTVVVFFAAAILISAIGLLSTGQDNFDIGTAEASLMATARMGIERISGEIRVCRVFSPLILTDHSSITYQIPIPDPVTGSIIDGTGKIRWGADGNLNWRKQLAFMGTGTFQENTQRKDFNRDGDILDAFELGRIVEQVYDDGTSSLQRQTTIAENIVVAAGQRDGDVKGDGTWDPIFLQIDELGVESITGNRVEMNLWLGKLSTPGYPVIINVSSEVNLRNPQD